MPTGSNKSEGGEEKAALPLKPLKVSPQTPVTRAASDILQEAIRSKKKEEEEAEQEEEEEEEAGARRASVGAEEGEGAHHRPWHQTIVLSLTQRLPFLLKIVPRRWVPAAEDDLVSSARSSAEEEDEKEEELIEDKLQRLWQRHRPSPELLALIINFVSLIIASSVCRSTEWVIDRSRLLQFGWWTARGVADPRDFFLINLEVYHPPPTVERDIYCGNGLQSVISTGWGSSKEDQRVLAQAFPFADPSEDPWCAVASAILGARVCTALSVLLAVTGSLLSLLLLANDKKLPTFDGTGRAVHPLLLPLLSFLQVLLHLVAMVLSGTFLSRLTDICPAYNSNRGGLLSCVVPGRAFYAALAGLLLQTAFIVLILASIAHQTFEKFRVSSVRVDSMVQDVKKGNLQQVLGGVVRGIPINLLGTDGKSALHWAAILGRGQIVRALLRSGADPNLPDREGWTALHYASRLGHVDVAYILAKSFANLNIRVKDLQLTGFTPLILAACRGHVDVAEILLELGANVDGVNGLKQTALMICAEEGQKPQMRRFATMLLRYGADTELRDIFGNTVLHYAASAGGSHELLQFLLESSDSELFRVRNKDGDSALDLARVRCDKAAITCLRRWMEGDEEDESAEIDFTLVPSHQTKKKRRNAAASSSPSSASRHEKRTRAPPVRDDHRSQISSTA